MSRPTRTRLRDIIAASDAIAHHLSVDDVEEGILFDALRIRLIEIGEAAKALPARLTASTPDVSWTDVARMRDHLARRYFDTTHAIVFDTARHDVPLLSDAARRLLLALDGAAEEETRPPLRPR